MFKFIANLVALISICSVILISCSNEKNKNTPPDYKFVEKQIFESLEDNGLPKSSISIDWSKSASGDDYIATIKCNNPEKCGKEEISIPFSNKNLLNNENTNLLNANQIKQLQPLLKNTGNEGPQSKPSTNGELEGFE